MAVIRLPTPLRSYAQGKAEVQVAGATISEALQDLIVNYPTLRPHLLNGEGQLRPFVNLFLGEENVMQMQGLNTPLKDNDRLLLIPSIAGGR
jgi:molybdopterin converting factor small subunit